MDTRNPKTEHRKEKGEILNFHRQTMDPYPATPNRKPQTTNHKPQNPKPETARLLHRNVQRFRGGLVFKAHRLLCHSALGWRVIKKKIARPPSASWTYTPRKLENPNSKPGTRIPEPDTRIPRPQTPKHKSQNKNLKQRDCEAA